MYFRYKHNKLSEKMEKKKLYHAIAKHKRA